MIEANVDNFAEKILKSERPVVTLFYATYCPHSKRFAPIFEHHSRDSPHAFAKADITDDDNPLWDRYNIEFVPTIVAFKDGKEAGRRGAVPGIGLKEEDLVSLLKAL